MNELIKLRRETGSLKPRPQGNGGGHGKLAGVTGRIDARVAAKGEITLDELAVELAETQASTSTAARSGGCGAASA